MSMLAVLLQQVRSGDPAALRIWVERLSAPGQRLAQALLGDAHEAEEAVQDALITALGHLDDLQEPDALDAWFRRIVRTEVTRRQRRRREHPSLASEAERPGPEVTPAEMLERSERRQKVLAAMCQLSPATRASAELFYLEDRSIAEIASMLQVPAGTVKRRLHAGRAALRELLGGADHWLPL